jgi:aryl-alcohol dehydrogenase-like predicted oxidoreductase
LLAALNHKGYADPMLKASGIPVSSLCFGTMSFGGIADKAESLKMYKACRDQGINFFDCANVYQKGVAEEILGEFIRAERDQVVITSKAYFPMGDGSFERGSNKKALRIALEGSLKRLKTDYIDVYFLHGFDVDTPLEETLEFLDNAFQAGKILTIGLSNFAAWQIMKAREIARARGFLMPSILQPMYNLVKRQAEVEILPMAISENIDVISYSPVAGGLLTGKYSKDSSSGRLKENAMYKSRYGDERYFSIADAFARKAAEMGLHPASLAVAWVAANDAVSAPIIGARNLEQLKPSLQSIEINLSKEEKNSLDLLSPKPAPATDRSEEASASFDRILKSK